jgi:hypothetical protein
MGDVGVLDDVLQRFAATGPEFGGGLANHGPMASEALVALGRPDAVSRWAEEYAVRLVEHPGERNRIESDAWREALGDVTRVGDWIAFFERQLDEREWQELLDEWTLRLSPGVMAGATHGIIRTAHAVRALEAGHSPERLHEFGEGLAYWAARYQELPGRPAGSAGLGVGEALQRVRRIDDSQRGRFLIFDAVRVLDEERFGDAINLVDAHRDSTEILTEMTGVFVRQFIANASTAAIGFVHTVTAPAALRILAPYLSIETTRTTMRYVWQACAAIYATYGRSDPRDTVAGDETQRFDREDLIDHAVAARDEHAIKFTEACLREHSLSGDDAFITAASEAVRRLGRGT